MYAYVEAGTYFCVEYFRTKIRDPIYQSACLNGHWALIEFSSYYDEFHINPFRFGASTHRSSELTRTNMATSVQFVWPVELKENQTSNCIVENVI